VPRIKYVGPIVGVDIPSVGLDNVQPGDEFDAPADVAAGLLADVTNYAPAGKSGKTDAQEG